jgi:ribosomal protein S18 acetylase RimI-like enzyme
MTAALTFRDFLKPGEDAVIRAITDSAGVFYQEEIDIAEELAREHLERGAEASGYHFLLAEADGEAVGYACFGPVPGARRRYDLYWIAVAEDAKGLGVGSRLMATAEARVYASGGVRIYVETSSRPPYVPARAFYRKCGYLVDAVLADYYDDGDDKVIFVKDLRKAPPMSIEEGGA